MVIRKESFTVHPYRVINGLVLSIKMMLNVLSTDFISKKSLTQVHYLHAFGFTNVAFLWHIKQTTSKSHYNILCDRFYYAISYCSFACFFCSLFDFFYHVFFSHKNKSFKRIESYHKWLLEIPTETQYIEKWQKNCWRWKKKNSLKKFLKWYLICFPFQYTHKNQIMNRTFMHAEKDIWTKYTHWPRLVNSSKYVILNANHCLFFHRYFMLNPIVKCT